MVNWHKGGYHSFFTTHYRLKRIGEIFYCLILFSFLCIPRILVFLITGHEKDFRWGFDTYFALLLTISFYVGYQIIQQMAVILGELEITATDFFRNASTEAFTFLKGFWLVIVSILVYAICWFDQISLILSNRITKEVRNMMIIDDIALLQFAILAAFGVQVLFTLGVFIFSLWYDSRLGISSFKGRFLKISNSINKLCGLSIYVVLYLIATYSIHSIAFNLSAHYEPLMRIYLELGHKEEPIIGIFWDFLVIGCVVILSAVTYFVFLGNLARNLESEELKKISNKYMKVNTLEEKSYLISYVAEVRRSLRTVSIIDYIARFALITYLGIFVKDIFLNI